MMSESFDKFSIVVIGETGCGKSTLINALLGKIVLPESPMTSTPVITYVRYSNAEEPYAEIFDRNHNIIETIDIKLFITKYCFTVKEQQDITRKRFAAISYAVIYIKSSFLENRVQLIDTLGFSATTHDTEATERILSTDSGLLFYVLSKNILSDFEVERIQNYLGYRTNKQIEVGLTPIKSKIKISDLYFLCNEKDGVIVKGLQNSIHRIFYSQDCKFNSDQINDFIEKHVLRFNFLAARTLNCGIYPYCSFLSDSHSKEESDFSLEMERRQRIFLKLDCKDYEYISWNSARDAINLLISGRNEQIKEHSTYINDCLLNVKVDTIKKILNGANSGHSDSQLLAGLLYEFGDIGMCVSINYGYAFMWYLKAARQYNRYAQYCLGRMYEYGKYVSKDYSQAVCWYKKSASQGYLLAQIALAHMLEYGNGVEQNFFDAFTLYKKAVRQKFSDEISAFNKSHMHGVKRYAEEYRHYNNMAESGDALAMCYVGMMNEDGIGTHRNYDAAFKWYKKATDYCFFKEQESLLNMPAYAME